MGYPITQQVTLNIETCCNCGIAFAMPDYLMKRRQADGDWFFCPNGHQQHYTKTEANRLREKLEEQTRMATQIAARAQQAELSAQKMTTELKRLKKRVAASVCPCCNRTFTNSRMERHIKIKHPEFEAEKRE